MPPKGLPDLPSLPGLPGLTGQTSIKFGPLLLKTLVGHYANQVFGQSTPSSDGGDFRRKNLPYNQAFTIVKDFMSTATKYTIEDLQEFSEIGIPSPPWVPALHVTVPMSCCDSAAEYLINALGGETEAKRIVGGTKWWQVREINGVKGEWIIAKKDRPKAKEGAKSRKRREREGSSQRSNTTDSASAEDIPQYTSIPDMDMDEQRCILFFHGGGYYFGSVNQERYSIQRFARKINGRVFAISYRLSPQYPFPCAIQDALAAYLYLIEPPPEAKHKPVNPKHIVIMGDSAGGGLALAALQVIRDSGLPQCGGGVLISPWCDLKHSFPSIHTKTKTDIIPEYGLSMHKPSPLWPPPDSAESQKVRRHIREWLGDRARLDPFLPARERAPRPECEPVATDQVANPGRHIYSGASTPSPNVVDRQDQKVVLKTENETLTVNDQIQVYAPNNLLSHPLISPCRAYLGGLPPLFFMAGDQEVLRDEIIYTAYRAAHPDKYPIPAESERLYPKITVFAAKNPTPTKVHLQVYDGCAHVLPIVFCITLPAKYCFRAIASFCRFATGMERLDPKRGDTSTGPQPETTDAQEAGRSPIYENSFEPKNFIGQRVSTQGIIGPLRPATEASALELEEALVGAWSERSLRRYLKGKAEYDKTYKKTSISAKKEYQLGLAHEEGHEFKNYLARIEEVKALESDGDLKGIRSALRNWSWALSEDENPPPSSIVSRRDTKEARKLAKVPSRQRRRTVPMDRIDPSAKSNGQELQRRAWTIDSIIPGRS